MRATEHLDEWLAERKKSGLLRKDFAARIGASPAILSRILAGEFRPGFDTMVRIRNETDGAITLDMWADG